jgi:uncharacterized protein (TIGR00369 family)
VTDTTPAPPAFDYPPRDHVLRDLPFEMEAVSERRSRVYLDVTPTIVEGGNVAIGALTTIVDVVAAGLVGRVIAPDWMATAALSLHLSGATATSGVVVADATVIRDGRTTVVVEVDLSMAPDPTSGGAGGPHSVGEAILTFARLPRRDTNLDIRAVEVRHGELTSFAVDGSGLRVPLAERVGIEVVDEHRGEVRVEFTDYIRNSFGAVNGGVVASIADAGARAAGRDLLGGPVRTVDLEVHYLVQGRTGPLSSRTSVVRHGSDTALVRAEVIDEGSRGDDGSPAVLVVAHADVVRI